MARCKADIASHPMVHLLGTAPDRQLAGLFGVSHQTLRRFRARTGIPSAPKSTHARGRGGQLYTRAELELIVQMVLSGAPYARVGLAIGRSVESVEKKIKQLQRKGLLPRRNRSLQSALSGMPLGMCSDGVVAALSGMDKVAAAKCRRNLRIQSWASQVMKFRKRQQDSPVSEKRK